MQTLTESNDETLGLFAQALIGNIGDHVPLRLSLKEWGLLHEVITVGCLTLVKEIHPWIEGDSIVITDDEEIIVEKRNLAGALKEQINALQSPTDGKIRDQEYIELVKQTRAVLVNAIKDIDWCLSDETSEQPLGSPTLPTK